MAATRKHEQTAACFFVQLFVNPSVLQLLIQLLHLRLALLQLLRELGLHFLILEGALLLDLHDRVGVVVVLCALQLDFDEIGQIRLSQSLLCLDLANGSDGLLELLLHLLDLCSRGVNLCFELLQLLLFSAHSDQQRQSERE